MASGVDLGRMTTALLVFGLAACAGPAAPIRPPADAAARLAGGDWTHAQEIGVTLHEYEFGPAGLHLRQGQPYRLQLANRGSSGHTFTSPGLFAASAVRQGPVANE